MTHVLVKTHGDTVTLLHIEGHAQGRGIRGGRYDLICAAVSAVSETLLQGFALLKRPELTRVDEKNTTVRFLPEDEPRQQVLVQSAVRTLEGIASEHKRFLEIHKMEV